MKRVNATAIMLLISVMTVSAQKQYSKEEQTIIGIIQEHYDLWKKRDYEKWTELWVHEDYVGHTSIGPNYFFDRKGWDEVSSAQKNFIKNNSVPAADVDFGQFDYTFLISDNMAIVKFVGENGLHTTSVFEKVKGTWKYVQNDQINKPLFDLKDDVNKLGGFEGNWRMVPGTFKWENSDNTGEFTNYEFSVTQTLNGVDISAKFSFRNAQKNTFHGGEDIVIIINSPSSELIHTRTGYNTTTGLTSISLGKVKVTDQSIELDGALVDNEKITYNGIIKMESPDMINVSWTPGSGAKWSVDMKLVN